MSGGRKSGERGLERLTGELVAAESPLGERGVCLSHGGVGFQ